MKQLHVTQGNVKTEIQRRIPWVLVSVLAGIIMIGVGERFEATLAQKTHLIFFIPMIVYMSDSIGTETLALFVRELALKKLSFHHLFFRELLVGLSLGLTSGLLMSAFSYWWFTDLSLALTVGLTMIINGIVAVLIGTIMPITFAQFGKDPALGTEEITTAISDIISMLVYLLVATLFLFRAS